MSDSIKKTIFRGNYRWNLLTLKFYNKWLSISAKGRLRQILNPNRKTFLLLITWRKLQAFFGLRVVINWKQNFNNKYREKQFYEHHHWWWNWWFGKSWMHYSRRDLKYKLTSEPKFCDRLVRVCLTPNGLNNLNAEPTRIAQTLIQAVQSIPNLETQHWRDDRVKVNGNNARYGQPHVNDSVVKNCKPFWHGTTARNHSSSASLCRLWGARRQC